MSGPAARNRGGDYAKSRNPHFPKIKRIPELCGKTAYVDSREHPSDRTSENDKKPSLDTLLLDKGSSKDFFLVATGHEPVTPAM